MRHKSLNSLTYGAMVCAMVGVLLLANRYLANVLDTYLFWIIPLPVIVYVVKFGIKDGLVMGVAMMLMSLVVSNLVSLFYVGAALAAGLVYGYGVLKKRSSIWLIASVIIISLAVMVITTFVAAGIFGYDLTAEIELLKTLLLQLQDSMSAGSTTAVQLPSYMTSGNFLLILIVLAGVLTSVMEGILVHLLATLVLKKLKLPMPVLKPLSTVYAPVWLKVYVFTCFLAYIMAAVTQITQYDEIIMVLGIIASLAAWAFGYILFLTWLTITVPDRKKRTPLIVVALIVFFLFPYTGIVLGLIDMFTPVRKNLLKRSGSNEKQDGSV